MRLSRTFVVVSILIVLLILAACQQQQAAPTATPEPGQAAQPEPTTAEGASEDGAASGELEVKDLVLQFGPDPAFATHVVAIEKGWFEEAGFNSVTTETFTAGALAGEAVVGGEIHLWTPGNLPPISMRHNGIPVVMLGTNAEARVEHLVARTDANIENPEDLYDIKIGLLEGSTASAVLNNLVEQYGLDADRLQVVNLPPPEQLTSLVNDEIQAMIVWAPFWVQALEQADAEVLHTGTVSHFAQDEGEEVQLTHTRSVWVVSEDFLRNNPNSTQAMIDVFLRAQDYVKDPANEEEVIQMYSEFAEQPVEITEAVWGNYTFDPTFDQQYVDDMMNYTDFLANAGRIESPVDIMDWTYTDPVGQIQPDAVQIEGKWQP